MSNRRKELANKLGLMAFGFGQKIFLTQDVTVAERRGQMIGNLAFNIMKKRREKTIANLRFAFPDWSEDKCQVTAKNVFRHFGLVTADFMRTPLRTNTELLENMEVENFHFYEQAVAVDKGIIACTAHLGNWERFGHWLIATGRQISVVARDANQGEIQDRVQKIRDLTGVSVLSRGDSARPILVKLKRKEIVGILPDQNSDESFTPFFGHLAGTVLGPAVLHQRTGAVLLPSYCIRVGPGKYKVVLKEPVDLANEMKSPEEIMAKLNLVLEEVIRDYPDQWLWMHDRWKSARKRNLL